MKKYNICLFYLKRTPRRFCTFVTRAIIINIFLECLFYNCVSIRVYCFCLMKHYMCVLIDDKRRRRFCNYCSKEIFTSFHNDLYHWVWLRSRVCQEFPYICKSNQLYFQTHFCITHSNWLLSEEKWDTCGKVIASSKSGLSKMVDSQISRILMANFLANYKIRCFLLNRFLDIVKRISTIEVGTQTFSLLFRESWMH